ncbi:MAG TPA: hypothetical protein VF950_13990 [Planctomycetota bacterium]
MSVLLLLTLLVQDKRLEVSADTSMYFSDSEENVNGGGRSQLRVKGIHNLLLFNLDVAPIKGKRVESARLHLRMAGPRKFKAVGLSSVATPWAEGEGNGPAKPGESSSRTTGKGLWAGPGSDFLSACFGMNGTIWFRRDVQDDGDGWVSCDFPPALLHALVEGTSHGVALGDEKNQTMANLDVYSREQSNSKPYVTAKVVDGAAPPSGAKAYVAPAEAAVAKREIAVAPAPPSVPGPWKVLHEGQLDPAAPSSGRLWNGKEITLEAARGEHVGFLLSTQAPLKVSGPGWSVSQVLPVGPGWDPLVPLEGEGKGLLHVERYVPKGAAVGLLRAPLTIGGTEVPVSVKVHAATLPDALGFHVSLNGYSQPQHARTFYRLAHEHRLTLALLGYSHRGFLDEAVAPEMKDGKVVGWKAFDERFGALFDGSAFDGLPRAGTPIGHFYLPIHENFPMKLNDHYAWKGKLEDHWAGAPPIEKAFTQAYADGIGEMVKATAAHIAEKKWTTDFHFFLNNKPFPREKGRAEGSWWCLDEPYSQDDFLALKYFGQIFKKALPPGAPIRFRIDLSRPHWRRDHLDGLMDLNVISGIYKQYPSFVFGKPKEEVWVYGGVSAPGANGESGRAWLLQVFLDGADGAVPWLALGTPKAWETPEDTALLLPPRSGMPPTAVATHRLKMLRRGQQDIELLRLLLAKKGWTRPEIRAGVASQLGLRGAFLKTSELDAGRVDYGALDSDRFEALRRAVLSALD